MSKTTLAFNLHTLHQALIDGSNEDAKRPKIYPFFQTLFPDDFKVESEAEGSDIYIQGKLLVELKTDDWVAGFYQALHYQKKGLQFSAICVIQNNLVAMWKIKDIPEAAIKLANFANPREAPSTVGKINSSPRKTSKSLKLEISKSACFRWSAEGDLFPKEAVRHLGEWVQQLRNLDANRIQINTTNFIDCVEQIEAFFPNRKMDAIHCFYSIVSTWDVTSSVNQDESGEYMSLTSAKTRRTSERVKIQPRFQEQFRRFVEQRYVFTNEGTGLTTDYYFSRFDEVMTRIDPEYASQHGIFFTDINLSKFANWFVRTYYEKNLGDKYIVLDPAGGSGNLVTSWKDHLKHKIVSELQPDLLKTIERRMRYDPEEVQRGYTIIPKTIENRGLNFLDQSAEEYYQILRQALEDSHLAMDKPLAFLLNPPYKNNDQNNQKMQDKEAAYDVDPQILALTGNDAGKERFSAFLAQILRLATINANEQQEAPIVMVFTPTSWLLPRPAFVDFRRVWDQHFKYQKGFIVNGSEFFKITGRWPLAFTIWKYSRSEHGNSNYIDPRDYTHLTQTQLSIDWDDTLENINTKLRSLLEGTVGVNMAAEGRGDIRKTLPKLISQRSQQPVTQTRYDYSRAKKKSELGSLVSGFPRDARKLHYELLRKCGSPSGEFIGLYGDNTPVRLEQDKTFLRMSNSPDRCWLSLDNYFKNSNLTRLMNGAPDDRGYCAYDLPSAKATLSWFALTKAVNGRYPIWANQFDIWPPNIKPKFSDRYYSLCFASAIIDNSCVVTRFEANNPVPGAIELYLDNPLSPLNSNSFFTSTLAPFLQTSSESLVTSFLRSYQELYRLWSVNYCKGTVLSDVGLKEEPYFKYFSYPDFVTPNSSTLQIRKFASLNSAADVSDLLDNLSDTGKALRDEIYGILLNDFNYFG